MPFGVRVSVLSWAMTPILVAAVRVAAGIVCIAIAARFSVAIPGTPVPQSLQTLAVLVVGAWLGLRLGALSTFLYAILGGAGLPIFADGASGMEHLRGPTAGYIAGFIIAAAWMGWVVEWWKRRQGAELPVASTFGVVSGAGVVGHAIILGVGWYGLGRIIGWSEAFTGGVAPFVVGGVVKSLAAAVIIVVIVAVSLARRAAADGSTPPA